MIRATLAILLLVLSASPPFFGSGSAETAPATGDAPATFSTSSQLVVETVNVKDKSGHPIVGLTQGFYGKRRRRGADHPFLRIPKGSPRFLEPKPS